MLHDITVNGTTPYGGRVSVTIVADLPLSPQEAQLGSRPMTVGATVDASDFGLLTGTGRNAGAKFCRTFSPPGAGIRDWTHPRRQVPAGVAEFHSFKDWPSDSAAVALVTQLLDTMPPRLLVGEPLLPNLRIYDPDGYATGDLGDGFSLLLTYAHEGEPDFIAAGLTAREWRRRHRLIYKTIRQHPHGHRVGYMPIQTGTWTEAISTSSKIKGDRDPLAWWAGVGDYAGWDAYAITHDTVAVNPALYPEPETLLELPVQLARGSGRRLFLAEFAVVRQGTLARQDPGSLRAGWIPRVLAHLDKVGAAGVAWWDALGTGGRDFRLDDMPSAKAWSDALAGRF